MPLLLYSSYFLLPAPSRSFPQSVAYHIVLPFFNACGKKALK
nr:MAG TPA: hypothetical protein [Caudoviricetes sp.]